MKPFFKSKISLWASVLALVIVIGVGVTMALSAVNSNLVNNTFAVADIDTEIDEVLDNGNKQVSITNNGPSDAYVRARIMVSGVNPENVEIVSEEPAEGDVAADTVYLVMQNNGTGDKQWTKEDSDTNGNYSDDFYYYLGVLAKDQKSKNLLEKVVLGKTLAEDQDFLDTFSVTIYHESVVATNQPETITIDTVMGVFNAAETSNSSTP